ncbi:MAG: hypothetical protein JXR67_05120 [Bacteroidales bacterium]|nr:hypothetical protein [Bacteroidales bacterium]
MKFSGCNFDKTTGAGVIAAGIPGCATASPAVSASAKPDELKLAIAGYIFDRIKHDDSLALIKKMGVTMCKKWKHSSCCLLIFLKGFTFSLAGLVLYHGYRSC